jgi:hypothetical protein
MYICERERISNSFSSPLEREREREKEEEEEEKREREKEKIDFVLLHPSRSLVRTNVHIHRSAQCTCDIYIDSVATIIDLYYIYY